MTNDLDSVRILAMVKDLLTERFDIPASKMANDIAIRELGLDSMVMLEVMLEMENRLSVRLKDLSMPTRPMLSDFVALIERNLVSAA